MQIIEAGTNEAKAVEVFNQQSKAVRSRIDEAGQIFLLKKELRETTAKLTETTAENKKLNSKIDELKAKGVVVKATFPVHRPYEVFRKYPSVEDIISIVADFYETTTIGIKSARRTGNLIFPRKMVCYLACELTGLSLLQIGQFIGGKDHTTVLYGKNWVKQKLADGSERLKDEIDLLKMKIGELLQARNAGIPDPQKCGHNRTEEKTEISLPFPPSVNDMFLNIVGRGRVKSQGYRAWLTEAGFALNVHRLKAVTGPVYIEIDLSNLRQGDADNRTKPILDLLCAHGILPDDSKKYVKRVSIGWENISDCRVKIMPIEIQ